MPVGSELKSNCSSAVLPLPTYRFESVPKLVVVRAELICASAVSAACAKAERDTEAKRTANKQILRTRDRRFKRLLLWAYKAARSERKIQPAYMGSTRLRTGTPACLVTIGGKAGNIRRKMRHNDDRKGLDHFRRGTRCLLGRSPIDCVLQNLRTAVGFGGPGQRPHMMIDTVTAA